MDSRTFYYARVSTKEQNPDRQVAAFIAMGAKERDIIIDKESGKSLERPGYLPTTMMELPSGQEWVFDMVNNILIEVLGTIAEQERVTIRKRQAEGIAVARQKGKRFGRPNIECPENWDTINAKWKAGEITAKEAMEQTGLKRSSFYKMVGRF